MDNDHVTRYIDYLQNLEPASLGAIGEYFSDRAHFVDPFNDVHGTEAIRGVFEHMFAHCEKPELTVQGRVGDGAEVCLRWVFHFGSPHARREIYGVSQVQFDPDGRVAEHIDYWDPAGQVYETIPILGLLMRALRRRLAATPRDTTRQRHDTATAREGYKT